MRYKLLILLLVLCISFSCQDPDARLDFKMGLKTRKQFELTLLDDRLLLILAGGGSGFPGDHRLNIGLGITVEYPELKGMLSFKPENIKVVFRSLPMDKHEHYINPKYHIVKDDYYYIRVSFYEPIRYDTSTISKPLSNDIKIILDDFLEYNGKAIEIDTIFAAHPRLK